MYGVCSVRSVCVYVRVYVRVCDYIYVREWASVLVFGRAYAYGRVRGRVFACVSMLLNVHVFECMRTWVRACVLLRVCVCECIGICPSRQVSARTLGVSQCYVDQRML